MVNLITQPGELYISTDMKGRDNITFKSIPFSNLNIDWRREEASTLSFHSPTKLTNGDRVRYVSQNHDFGGQVYKIEKSLKNLYTYQCISYKRLYDTKVVATYKNKTSKQILKDLLKKNPNNFRYDGLKSKSTLRHQEVTWQNKSLWEVIGNLAWLEYKAGSYINYYIDAIGRLVWEDIPQKKAGLVVSEVMDYDINDDATDFITQGIFINQLTGKTLANVKATNDLILRWGYIAEYGECDLETNTAGSSSVNGKFNKSFYNMGINKYTSKVPSKAISITGSICNPKKKDKDNLKKIYNWVQKHIKYNFYYNTRKSVTKVITSGCGNCCDQASLVVALARAAGIKSQFVRGHNHVFSRHYISGGWFFIDCSTSNGWGRHLQNSRYGGPPFTYYNTLPF